MYIITYFQNLVDKKIIFKATGGGSGTGHITGVGIKMTLGYSVAILDLTVKWSYIF